MKTVTSYIINEGFEPAPVQRVEADRYGEEGSFTKFYDADDNVVLSVRTDVVFGIRTA